MFEEIGLDSGQLFVLLFLGLGPIRICLSWLSIANELNFREQRRVAWRITWIGMVLVAGIMFLGYISIRNVTPQREWLGIGASIVLIVSSLAHRTPASAVTNEPPYTRAMRMAIHPLAVPIMINPAGLGLLLIVAAFVRDVGAYSTFFAVVVAIFLVNFGLMILLGRLRKEIPTALIQLFGEIFAILLVSLGVYYIFRNLSHLGLINLNM